MAGGAGIVDPPILPFLKSPNNQTCRLVMSSSFWPHGQAPPSMGFSRQEYWSGLPFPSPSWGSKTHVISGSQSAVRDPWSPFSRVHKVKLFCNNMEMLVAFLTLFSQEYTVEFSRSHTIWNVLTAMGMWACIFMCFKFFSVLLSPKICTGRYNLDKSESFRVVNNFVKFSWD